jgi:hypothetical protein
VDCNEYGWLVKFRAGQKPQPYVVDVDSWQVGRWKAKVIMPSIRDYHAKTFSEVTDWFSWGVVTFQVYSGIHPYKGTLDGFTRNDFVARMKANASVFGNGVRLNRAVRDFSVIPGKLRSWYETEFQTGSRTVPPSPFDTTTTVSPKVSTLRVSTQGSGMLRFKKIFAAPPGDPAVRIFNCGVALLRSGQLVSLETGRGIGLAATTDCEVVAAAGGFLVVERDQSKLHAWYTEGSSDRSELSLSLDASGILRFGNRVFAVTRHGLTELSLQMFSKPVLAPGTSWEALTSSTKFFDGLGVQNTLGAAFLLLPHGDHMLSYVKTAELDGLMPVQAKAGERFVQVVALDKKGIYHKFEFSFSKDYRSYTLWRTTTDTPDLVSAILGRGVCATVVDDGELVVFVPTGGQMNRFRDSTIATDEPLFAWDDKVLLLRAGDVWQVSVVTKP